MTFTVTDVTISSKVSSVPKSLSSVLIFCCVETLEIKKNHTNTHTHTHTQAKHPYTQITDGMEELHFPEKHRGLL